MKPSRNALPGVNLWLPFVASLKVLLGKAKIETAQAVSWAKPFLAENPKEARLLAHHGPEISYIGRIIRFNGTLWVITGYLRQDGRKTMRLRHLPLPLKYQNKLERKCTCNAPKPKTTITAQSWRHLLGSKIRAHFAR